MNREKQILNYHLCEQLKDQNIKMAKLVDKLVNLSIHKSWEEDSFSSQKLLYQNALTELMSAQSSFNKVVGQVDWLIKGHKSAERRNLELMRLEDDLKRRMKRAKEDVIEDVIEDDLKRRMKMSNKNKKKIPNIRDNGVIDVWGFVTFEENEEEYGKIIYLDVQALVEAAEHELNSNKEYKDYEVESHGVDRWG